MAVTLLPKLKPHDSKNHGRRSASRTLPQRKKTGQKGVRENHSHIMLTAVALAPSLKSKAIKEIWEWIGIIESPKKISLAISI